MDKTLFEKIHTQHFGPMVDDKRIHLKISSAEEDIDVGFRSCVGQDYVPLSYYKNVADWLKNNRKKGLMMYGPCGVGKSILLRHILPVILTHRCGLIPYVCSSRELVNPTTGRLKEQLNVRVIFIDDVGCEDSISKAYGNQYSPFADIVEKASKDGNLLVFSTNLQPTDIERIYGKRTLSRLYELVDFVLINHDDMRRKR